mgnify:CR=1 FL=1
MQFHDPNYPSLEWNEVAPLIYDLHDQSLDPYMVRWPRLAWLARLGNEHSGRPSWRRFSACRYRTTSPVSI